MRGGAGVRHEQLALLWAAGSGLLSRALKGPLAGGDDRAEKATGGRVVDHTTANAGAGKSIGKAQQLPQPVKHMGLEFRAGR